MASQLIALPKISLLVKQMNQRLDLTGLVHEIISCLRNTAIEHGVQTPHDKSNGK
jgi:hypothetical protein